MFLRKKFYEKKHILSALFFLCTISLYSQDIFERINANNYSRTVAEKPEKFKEFKLLKSEFLSLVSNTQSRATKRKTGIVISLPDANGNFEQYKVFEASILSKELSDKYPLIKSYVGESLKGKSNARFSYSPSQGLYAAISKNKQATILIKPSNLKEETYVVFSRNAILNQSDFECNTINEIKKTLNENNRRGTSNGYLRKYRLALATTGEFSNYFLDGSETNDTEKKAKVLAGINTSLTRINGIFERDFSVTMELVANTDATIYLDPNSDPFYGNFNQELQNTLDTEIGDENYDVGHLFGYQNSVYGSAGCIACVCKSGSKGSGFSVHSDPSSDGFNLLASHEFGHQFGSYHVQSSSNCRSSVGLQEVEPGSGSSIMGYAGICPPNVQETSDDYFNFVNIRDVLQWTGNNSSCAELIDTNNTDPKVNAGLDYTIPKSTAFVLDGIGSDVDASDILTYCWEENDPENPFSSDYPNSTRVFGPMYRSKIPVSESKRYMPQLSDVLLGNLTPTWEVTPSVSRTLDFVLTVRDNALLGAKTASDQMTVTVDAQFGPFVVTSQKSTEIWNVGDTKTITWNVANTTNSPINAANVDLLLSIDGGYTYPYTLASGVTNDGSEEIIVPEVSSATTEARFMVKASNNIFFAVNQSNFQINTKDFIMSFDEISQTVCNPSEVTYSFTYKTFLGFDEETVFSTESLLNGMTVNFIPASASVDGIEVKAVLSNASNFPFGKNQFIVKGTSTSFVKQVALDLNLYSDTIVKPILSLPANNENQLEKNVVLSWENNLNAENYVIDIATDDSFNTIIDTEIIKENTYSSLNLEHNTDYYWRVKGENYCTESDFSDVFKFSTSCAAPNLINTSNIAINTADIVWAENGNASSWEVEIVIAGETATGSGEIVNTRNYTATNLIGSTAYDVYVRSLCSDTVGSLWVGSHTFSTLIDFCNGENFYDSGGADGEYQNNESITTKVSSNGTDIVEVNFLSFDLRNGADFLRIYDIVGDNYTYLGHYTGNTLPPVIRSSQGGDLEFYFTSDSSFTSADWEAEVNCITLTCPAPTNFIATNIQANSVDLNWVSNGDETNWEIEYGEIGFTLGTETNKLTTESTFKLEGLNPKTNYSIYARAVCGENSGEDDSFWTNPITIKTPCGVYNAPYFYEVAQEYYGRITDCWTVDTEPYTSNYFWNVLESRFYENSTGPYKSKSGSYYFGTSSYYGAKIGDVTSLVSPEINIASLADPVLDFYTFMYGQNIGSLHVDIFNNGAWVEDVLVLEGAQQTNSKDFWKENIVDLKDFENIIQIKFRTIAGGYDYTEIDIDDISVIERPTCPNPTELNATNVEANSVELNWTANGDETKWEIEYGEAGFILGEGTTVLVATYPFILTNLIPVTNYEIYVKSICGESVGDDDSNQLGPINIETPCGVFYAPYFYDVEQPQYSSAIQDCWTSVRDSNSDNYWVSNYSRNYENTTGPYKAKSGNRYFATSNYSNLGDVTELISPIINISALTAPALDFHSFMHGENIGSLHIGILNNGVWTEDVLVITGAQQDDSRDLWEERLVDLNAFSGNIQVKFRAISGGYITSEIDLDDISVIEMPTCLNPTDFEVSNITYDSVALNWTANSSETQWEVEYEATGFTPGNGAKVVASTNPFILTGLDSETFYDIYVRASCGTALDEDDSSWVGPINIETPCSIFEAPYFHDVEQQYSSEIDDCWTAIRESYSNNYWFSNYGRNYENTTGPYKAKSGNRYFATSNYSNLGDVTELISPVINISALTIPTLDFHSFMHGENIGSLHIGILNNGVWTEDVLVITGAQQNSSRDLWRQQLVDLSAFTGNIQIKFRAISGGYRSNEIDLDDINVIEMPTCLNPTDFEVSNITYESVALSWTANSSETQWEVEYGATGFTPGNGTKVLASTNPFILTGLDSESFYDIYIKSVCGDNVGEDDSNQTGPISIETPCGVFDAPYFYDVEEQSYNEVDDCWIATPESYSSYRWLSSYSRRNENSTGPYQAKSGSRYFAANSSNYSNIGDLTELTTPLINIDLLTIPALDFYSFMHGRNIGSLHIDVLNNGVWTEDVFVINGSQQNSSRDLWRQQLVDLSAFSGVLQIKFRALSGGGYNTAEIDLDDISVIEMPSCLNPTDFEVSNITYESAELSWTANSSETQWEVEYGATGFTPGNGTKVLASTNPFILTGLDSESFYDIYIKSVCGDNVGGDDSNQTGPISIETPCGVFDAPYFYDVEEQNYNEVDDCWIATPESYSSYRWLSFYSRSNENSTGPYQAKSGSRYFAANSSNYSNIGDLTELTTPLINIDLLTIPALDFYSFMHGRNIGSLHIDVLNNGVWTEDVFVINGSQQNSSRDLWLQQLVDLSAFSGVIQIKFRALSGGGYNAAEIDLDDISVIEMPTCLNPTGFEVSNVTYESAELSWTANSSETQWEVEYGATGFTPGNGTKVLASTNPFILTGLDSESFYDIYIKSVCGDNVGGDDSNQTGPISIETPCGVFDAPYFYDVEEQNYNEVDDCWIATPKLYSSYRWLSSYSRRNENSTGPYQAKSGSRYFATNSSNYSNIGDLTELTTPLINIDLLTIPALDFYSFMHGQNIGSLHIDVLNNGVWTEDVFVINGSQQKSSRDLWRQQLVDLSAFSGVIKIRFRALSGGGYNAAEIDLDDISVIEMPTCPNPLNIQAQDITDTSISLSWDSIGAETAWQIEYGVEDFLKVNGTKLTVENNPFVLSNLDSQTKYDIYLRAICGTNPGEDDSDWIGPINIKTLPNFCNGDHFYDSGGENNNYTNYEDEVTVVSSIGNDFVEVNFLEFNIESCCDRLYIYDGPDISSPSLGSFSTMSLPRKFVSTHETGTLTFRFTSDGSSTGRGWDAEVKCISITCPKPSNVNTSNLKSNEATISWDAGATENNWQIEYGSPNFNIGDGTRVDVANNPYVLNGLEISTSYQYYTRTLCGNESEEDNSEWVGPYSFETSCGRSIAPFYEDFVEYVTPICWSESGDKSWNFNTYAGFDAKSAGDKSPNKNTNYAWIDGSFYNGENEINKLKTNWIDTSNLTNPALEFSLFSSNKIDNTYNTFKVVVYDDKGVTSELYNIQSSTNGWKVYAIELTDLNLSNLIQIEFIVIENSPGNPYLNDILLDEVKVDNRVVLSSKSDSISNFRYYPSPIKNKLTIQSDDEIRSVIIFNVLGQKVVSFVAKENSSKIELDVSKLSAGTYVVKAFSKSKTQSFRVIKK